LEKLHEIPLIDSWVKWRVLIRNHVFLQSLRILW